MTHDFPNKPLPVFGFQPGFFLVRQLSKSNLGRSCETHAATNRPPLYDGPIVVPCRSFKPDTVAASSSLLFWVWIDAPRFLCQVV
jgi:hypothetical protein